MFKQVRRAGPDTSYLNMTKRRFDVKRVIDEDAITDGRRLMAAIRR